MGDISHILPSIHPFVGGVCGAHHTKDFHATDHAAACVLPAKIMAMTVIDLLADNASCANQIRQNFRPVLTKAEYLALLDKYFS